MTNLRYPGPKPFTSNEKALFFGREDEAEKLNGIVCNNRITVLLGRSGYGKSSLIQAGVIPYFKDTVQYEVIQVRFTGLAAPKQQVVSLIDQLKQELQKLVSEEEIFLQDLTKGQTPGLWQIFKSVQWKIRKEKKGVLFILDQFEEIFKFSLDYFQFSNELAELVHNRMPDSFQAALTRKIEADEVYYTENQEAIEFIRGEIQTSFLIGIRSDRMFLLDELGASIPTIFNNRFRLEALSLKKLSRIIREPAIAGGEFMSKPFTFSDGLIAAIRKYLSTSGPGYKAYPTIEAFELQIICQHIELGMIKKQALAASAAAVPASDKLLEADERMIAGGFDRIIEDYYVSIIENDKFNEFERLVTRFLIERKLVDQKTGNRICVDKTSILPFGITDEILDKILETRIVRKELNTVSGESFELSHDTLISAIQQASIGDKLGDLNDQITRYYAHIARQFRKPLFFWKTAVLEKKLVDRHGNLVKVRMRSLANKPGLVVNAKMLEQRGILNSDGPAGNELFVLNEVFQDAVIARVNRSSRSKLKRYTIGFFAVLVLAALIVLLTVQSLKFSASENALRIATTTNLRRSEDPQARNLLLLFNDLYGIVRKSSDSLVRETLKTKLVKQFGYLYLIGDSVKKDTLNPIDYDISRDDSFLLSFLSPSNILYAGHARGSSTARIYDKAANRKWSCPGVDYAALLGRQLFILKKDSLNIYDLGKVSPGKLNPPHKSVMLGKSGVIREYLRSYPNDTRRPSNLPQPGADDLSFSVLKPIRYLDNNNLLVVYNAQIRLRLPFVKTPTPYFSTFSTSDLLGVVNLRTGSLSSLQSVTGTISWNNTSVSQISDQSSQGQYPQYYLSDSSNHAAVLTQDGHDMHYIEYVDADNPQQSYSRVTIPASFFPVPSPVQMHQTSDVILCNFNFPLQVPSFAIPVNVRVSPDTVQLLKMSVAGKTGAKITIGGGILDVKQSDDNTLAVVARDGIRIFDKDLRQVCYQPCDPLLLDPFNDRMVYRANRLLYLVQDSILALGADKKGQAGYSTNLHSFVSDFFYSSSGDSIFCATIDNTLHILDKQLHELFVCYGYKPFRSNRVHGVFVSTGNDGPWYIIQLNKEKNRFHNVDPDQVSDWIVKYCRPSRLSDSLRRVHRFIGNDIVKQLGNLFNE